MGLFAASTTAVAAPSPAPRVVTFEVRLPRAPVIDLVTGAEAARFGGGVATVSLGVGQRGVFDLFLTTATVFQGEPPLSWSSPVTPLVGDPSGRFFGVRGSWVQFTSFDNGSLGEELIIQQEFRDFGGSLGYEVVFFRQIALNNLIGNPAGFGTGTADRELTADDLVKFLRDTAALRTVTGDPVQVVSFTESFAVLNFTANGLEITEGREYRVALGSANSLLGGSIGRVFDSAEPAAVPVPGALALFGAGLLGLAAARRPTRGRAKV